MSKYSGYMGKVMMMDLSTGEVEEYPWSADGDRSSLLQPVQYLYPVPAVGTYHVLQLRRKFRVLSEKSRV